MLQPTHDRVLIRVIKDDKTKTGLILPTNREVKVEQGEVVAVGPGRTNDAGTAIAPACKAGDRVLFGRPHDAAEVVDGAEKLLLIGDYNVFAIER